MSLTPTTFSATLASALICAGHYRTSRRTLRSNEVPNPPRPLPLPLQEIAIEHFKVTTSWPLPHGSLLLPNYDLDQSGFRQECRMGRAAICAASYPIATIIPQMARVLRKVDGTGFFIVVPAAVPGQYRLKMAYRRDNRSADPDSQVLSEAGSSAPEHVTIDIPW